MIIDVMCQTLALFVFTLCAWSGLISFKTAKIIRKATSIHGKVRTSDKIILAVSGLVALTNAFLIFIHPGLFWTLPGAVAMCEVGLSFLLWYLYELQTKNWERFKTKVAQKS